MNTQDIQTKLSHMRKAYRALFLGSQSLIEMDALSWTERWLLRLVNRIARQRLAQVGEADASLPDLEADDRLRVTMLEFQVEASLAGHDLSGWEETEDGSGYQAVCRQCGASVYVGDGLVYSILAETCPGKDAFAV